MTTLYIRVTHLQPSERSSRKLRLGNRPNRILNLHCRLPFSFFPREIFVKYSRHDGKERSEKKIKIGSGQRRRVESSVASSSTLRRASHQKGNCLLEYMRNSIFRMHSIIESSRRKILLILILPFVSML